MTDVIKFEGLGLEFTVNKVAFSIGGFNIYWYGILITAGLLLAIVFGLKSAKKYGLDTDRMIDVIIAGMFGAFIGARLYYVVFNLDRYDSFYEIINVRDGGLAIYGGLIGAILVGFIFARIRKLKFAPMLDLAAQGFLIGQAIGRWGNFFNREAFGCNTTLPWAMTSEDIKAYLLSVPGQTSSMGVHPTFLYESLWCALGFLALWLYSKHRKFDGEVFLLYLIWYGSGRFFIEGLRTDSLMLGNLRVSQALSAICVIAALILLFVKRSKIKRYGAELLYVDTEESKLLLSGENAESKEESVSEEPVQAEEISEEKETDDRQ